jgi:F420-dependent oxidoreductase-like protein
MAQQVTRRTFVRGLGGAAAAALVARGLSTPRRAAAAPSGGVRFGVQPRPEHTTWADMERVWQEADRLGLDSIFTFDHLMPIDGRPGPCFEGWTTLAALAAKTERIRVGVLVTGNTYRNPALVAKMAATVDHATRGRLILGLGAAWFEAEHRAYGFDFYTPGGRARRLVEAVTVIKSLFTHDRSSFAGKYYRLDDAPFDPKTVQRPHPPILIGGMGPKVIQPLVAREADIWHFFVRGDDAADEARRAVAHMDALCREHGRDPATLEKSVSIRPEEVADSAPKAMGERLKGLVDAGVRHFILSLPAPYDDAVLRKWAGEVMPALRTG